VTNHVGDCCTVCSATTFSWKPTSTTCDACPKNETSLLATCSADLLVPIDGYWHSAPHSPQVIKCPVPAACKGRNSSNRTDLIVKYLYTPRLLTTPDSATVGSVNATSDLVDSMPDNLEEFPSLATVSSAAFNYSRYYELLCSNGYHGNLCAQCNEGYGSTSSGECIVCPRKGFNTLYFFLAYLVNVFIVVLTVKSQTAKLPGVEQGGDGSSSVQSGVPMQVGQVWSLSRLVVSYVKWTTWTACLIDAPASI
jgi:hypothetical protein